jgi:aspartyl-tRNA(Asn)/glutamyl-tRNA(Gln) amidotransferase subunit A
VLARLRSSQAFTAADYARARRAQVQLMHDMQRVFRSVDLTVAPTTPMAAPRFENPAELEKARNVLSWFTAPFNMAGLPAISIPCGFTADGLPIGLQLVAAPWQEAQLLRAAFAYEQATAWHLRRPPIE